MITITKLFKGTRGPWKHRHSENNPQWVVTGTQLGERYKIARLPYLNDPVEVLERERKEQEANAKLIAAAPDLLESLIQCVKKLENYEQVWGFDESKMIDKAEKAISKALD